ncbi:hypothetical protein HBH69_196430 [Parastagonospora nodorum]|nr:hypothetical protein HBH52_047820 [Parastagonospora nodorum]KAH5142700.1 hypothetical protein HBH69_196430 [Parastagonospora nodorum]KAH5224063.1 hypothetical protein HBH68_027500 [Parastagonospora nodorum]KAH5438232.1 hypothetical protein HBI47_060550 [Parastagonospora nodorum]KAH5698500.1 hypothetical protein HBI44_076510 [Parastagonospora nodorum]
MRSLTSHQVQVASSCLSIITQTCPAHVHSHSLVSSSFTSRLTAPDPNHNLAHQSTTFLSSSFIAVRRARTSPISRQ